MIPGALVLQCALRHSVWQDGREEGRFGSEEHMQRGEGPRTEPGARTLDMKSPTERTSRSGVALPKAAHITPMRKAFKLLGRTCVFGIRSLRSSFCAQIEDHTKSCASGTSRRPMHREYIRNIPRLTQLRVKPTKSPEAQHHTP